MKYWTDRASVEDKNTEDWLKEAFDKIDAMPPKAREVREAAMDSLWAFARIVNPGHVYGSIHRDIFEWMEEYTLYGQGTSLSENKLIMLPRAHLKSHMVATWAAWMITRHPEITILYISATAELAGAQLYDIKNILSGNVYRKYWPEYVNPAEGRREKWSSTAVMVDHPRRKSEGVRDATIKIAGLTTNTTGWHADIVCADDLVVPENAYTEEGRDSVSKKSSQFTSIRNTGGFTMACGTRYHPADIYADWKEAVYEDWDNDGEYIGKKMVWSIKEFKVEEDDIFLWPRAVRADGKAFGFDKRTLSRIKAEYSDKTQYFAQYYNDPNNPESNRLTRDKFQYLNPRFLKNKGGTWYYQDRKLNTYAAVDFAYSLKSAADFTAIVVIGIDHEGDIYVLDIDRFKTDKSIEYFRHIRELHNKWNFKRINAEVTAAQKTIVESIKHFIKKEGVRKLKVEEYRPTKVEGSKEQRIAAVLEHRYDDLSVYHTEGGWTNVLEDELIQARPQHDDIKDALASAVSIAVKPAKGVTDSMKDFMKPQTSSGRFGGYK